MSSARDKAYKALLNRQRWLSRNRDDLLERRDRLISLIERDFAGVTRNDGVSIREAYVIDDYGSDQERAAARAEDTDSHWAEVDLPALDPGGSALSFMDPIGFRYHLPAFMCFTLRFGFAVFGSTMDENCLDSAMYHLTSIGESMWRLQNDKPPTISPKAAKFHTERLAMLNAAQRRCCARFLVFSSIADEYDDSTHSIGYRWWIPVLPENERAEARQIWLDP